MKKYRIWFFLLMKRTIKKPAFFLLLLSLPLVAIGINRLEQEESGGVVIGIVIEAQDKEPAGYDAAGHDAAEYSVIGQRETVQDTIQLSKKLAEKLSEQDGIFEFQIYDNTELLLRDVKRGILEGGFVLPENLEEKMNTKSWQNTITVYKTASDSMVEIAKEKIASALFTLYSEENYVNYIESAEAFLEAEANGNTREEIVSFAKAAYETHLMDGSTFSFQYQEDNHTGQQNREPDDAQDDEQSDKRDGAQQVAAMTFRLRGVLAVCIFLSGLCGLLTDWKDRQEKRFVRIVPAWVTTAVNIWIPTIYTSLVSFAVLCLTGQISGSGNKGQMVGTELIHLFVYQFLIVVYCSIIRLVLRRQEIMAAAIPMLTLASFICCPVWIRLAVYLPIFRILEKLFPVTYYLLL